MIAGAGVCILSQHSILEYFPSFLCILLGLRVTMWNITSRMEGGAGGTTETTFTGSLFLKPSGKNSKFGLNCVKNNYSLPICYYFCGRKVSYYGLVQ